MLDAVVSLEKSSKAGRNDEKGGRGGKGATSTLLDLVGCRRGGRAGSRNNEGRRGYIESGVAL